MLVRVSIISCREKFFVESSDRHYNIIKNLALCFVTLYPLQNLSMFLPDPPHLKHISTFQAPPNRRTCGPSIHLLVISVWPSQ